MTYNSSSGSVFAGERKGRGSEGRPTAGIVGILGAVPKVVMKQSTKRYVDTCLFIKHILSTNKGLGAFAQAKTSAVLL